MRRLCILAKAPVAGQVKTRMQPTLSPEQAATLQTALVARTLRTAHQSSAERIELWITPDPHHEAFARARQQHPALLIRRQPKGDLGWKMAQCFDAKPENIAVVIGTDCPALTADHIDNAFDATGHSDCHFIPAHDGGYVLVASGTVPRCFQGIEWGSDRVWQQTREALRRAGQSLSLQPPLPDLDRVEDIKEHPSEVLQGLGLDPWIQAR